MKRVCLCVFCVVLSAIQVLAESPAEKAAGGAAGMMEGATASMTPLSRLALGGGFSVNGINLQAATNLGRSFNLRATGNIFKYTANDLNTKGFNGTANFNMATFGASLDYYPWATHGLRVSPGLLFYNQNRMSGTGMVAGNQTFTLNSATYLSSPTQPVQGSVSLALNSRNPAFTMTVGWGNMISRTGGHWSFPVEIGGAFVGDPKLSATLSGLACDTRGLGCVNVATDPTIQANLNTQVAKSQKDLNVLRVYPIVSFGVAYSFNVR